MHIKRLLSCTMAALLTITSFNLNVMAAELPDAADDGANVVEEQQVDVPDAEDADGQEDPEPAESSPSEEDGLVVVPENDQAEELVVEDEADELLKTAGYVDYPEFSRASATVTFLNKAVQDTGPDAWSYEYVGESNVKKFTVGTDDELTINEGALTLTIADPEHNDYDFAGWAGSSVDETVTITPGQSSNGKTAITITTTTEDSQDAVITLTATWTEKASADSVTVTFKPNDGTTGEGATADKTQSFTSGVAAPITQTFSRTGYTLAGWGTAETSKVGDDDVIAVDESITVTGATTYYAVWRPNVLTVKYESDTSENENITGEMADETFAYDEITGETKFKANTFTYPNHAFKEWQNKAATSTKIANQAVVSNTLIATGDVTLTLQATWTPYSATVTYTKDSDVTGAASVPSPTSANADNEAVFADPGDDWAKANSAEGKKQEFKGWKATTGDDTKVYEAGEKIPVSWMTAAGAAITVEAQWGDETVIDITTLDIKFGTKNEIEYDKDGTAVATVAPTDKSTLTVKNGTKTVDNSLFTVGGLYTKKADNSGYDSVTEGNLTDVGSYYIKVTTTSTKYGYDSENADTTGIAYVEYKVVPKEISVVLAADKKSHAVTATTTGEGENAVTTYKYHLYFYTAEDVAASTATTKPVEGKDAWPVEPTITFKDAAGGAYTDSALVEKTAEVTTGKYTLTYSGNTGETSETSKAKVIVKLLTDNYTFADDKNEVEQEYEIVEDTESTFTGTKVEKKAKFSQDKSEAGTIYKYGATYHKRYEDEIPAVKTETILPLGDQTKAELDTISVDKIYDENGNEINGSSTYPATFTVSDRDVDAEEANGTFKVTASGSYYEGSYTVTYKFATECKKHKFTKHIHAANFENDGSWRYECDNCGALPADAAEAGLEEGAALSGTIAKLNAQPEFTLKNTNDSLKSLAYSYEADAKNEIQFMGEAIKVDPNSVVVKLGDGTVIPATRTVDGKEVANYTFTTEPYTALNNKAEFTITIDAGYADGYYEGATITKTFKIVAAKASVAPPRIKNSVYSVDRGETFELVSDTPGATIFYQISKPGDTPFDPTDSSVTDYICDIDNDATADVNEDNRAALITSGKVKTYNDPILVDKDVNVLASSRTVEIRAFAVKNIDGVDVYSSAVNLTVSYIPEPGDVLKGDLDGSYNTYSGTKYINSTYLEQDDIDSIPEGLWVSRYTMTQRIVDSKNYLDDSFDYSGNAKVLEYPKSQSYTRVFFGNELLTYGTDYTVSYKNNVNAFNATGSFDTTKAPTLVITGKGKYAGVKNEYFTINKKVVADASTTYEDGRLTITSSIGTQPSQYDIYVAEKNGVVQKPKFTIKYTQWEYTGTTGKQVTKTLKEGTDFIVDYDNIRAEAKKNATTGDDESYLVPIEFRGNYGGDTFRNLYVVSQGRDISKATVTVDTKGVSFEDVTIANPQDNNVKITVKIGDTVLKRGTDYTVGFEYLSAPKGYEALYGAIPGKYEVFSAGKYNVTITGDGVKYCGTKTIKNVSIAATGATTLANKNAEVVPSETSFQFDPYDSTVPTSVKVKYGNEVLTEDVDYVLVYPTTTKAGKNTITAYGIGKYTGSKAATYTLTERNLKDDKVTVSVANNKRPYKGSKYYASDFGFTLKVPQANQADAVLSTNYYTVTMPNDMTTAGTKTIKFTGRNGWKGTITTTVDITPVDITNLDAYVWVSGDSAQLKTRDGLSLDNLDFTNAAPYVYVEDDSYYPNVLASTSSKDLKNKFKVSFKNSKGKANKFEAGETITVTITGDNKNLKGSLTGTYKVADLDVTDANKVLVSVSDVQKNKAKVVRPTIKVTSNLTNKVFSAKTDYKVDYLTNDGTYTTVTTAFDADTEYIARITGLDKGLTGTKDVVFRTVEKSNDIATATITVNRAYTYDGINPVTVDKDDLTVVLNKLVVPSDGYEISGYENNAKAGTAKVTVHGIGAYAGYKTVNVPIAKGNVNYSVEFRADRYSKDADNNDVVLTIAGTQKIMTNSKSDVFTLPTTSYKATYVKKVVTTKNNKTTTTYPATNYALAYYYLDGDESTKLYPGQTIKVNETYGCKTGEPLKLVAKFVVIKLDDKNKAIDSWTLKYDSNLSTTETLATDTKNIKSAKVKVGATHKIGNQGFKRTGHTLLGFSDTKLGVQAINYVPAYKVNDLVSNLEIAGEAKTIYAVWAVTPAKEYTISYNLDGGYVPAATLSDTTKYPRVFSADGSNVTLPSSGDVPTKVGYTFKQWEIVKGTAATTVDKTTKKNVTVKAVYTANTNIGLSYKWNDDVTPEKTENATAFTVGDSVTLLGAKTTPVTSTNTELTFVGWAKDKNAKTAEFKPGASVKFVTNKPVVLYGVWKHQTYKLNYAFEDADKKAGAKITVAGDATYTKAGVANIQLPTVKLAGYKFDGWSYKSATDDTAVTYDPTDSTKLTALQAKLVSDANAKPGITLTAKFTAYTDATAPKATITFDTDVTSYSIPSITVISGKTATLPAIDASKNPNMDFMGWESSETGKIKYVDKDTFAFNGTADKAITLTAVWEKTVKKINYTGVAGFKFEEGLLKEWDKDTNYTFPDLETLGYTSVTWKLVEGSTKTDISSSGVKLTTVGGKASGSETRSIVQDITVEFAAEKANYTITYAEAENSSKTVGLIAGDWGKDSNNANKNNPNKATYTVTDAITITDPTRTGYTFDGWTDGSGAEPTKAYKIAAGTTGNLTLTAHWTANEYKVELTLNGATTSSEGWVISDDATKATKTFTVEDAVSKPTVTKKNNTVAIMENGAAVTDGVAKGTTENKTWTVSATPLTTKLDITFKASDAANAETKTQTIYSDDTGDALKLMTNPFEAPTGKKFKDWKKITENNATTFTTSKTTFTDKEEITGTTAEALTGGKTLTLEAEWEAITGKVQYNKNDGTGFVMDSANRKVDSITYSESTKIEIPKDISREGYTFEGWSTKRKGDAEFTMNATTNKIEAHINPSYDGQTITLYAVWTPVEYTITYDVTGGTNASDNPAKYTIETAEITLADATPTDATKEFKGWVVGTKSGTDVNYAEESTAAKNVKIPHGSTGEKYFKAVFGAKTE